ncbi:hypothetical protein HU200_022313 [Digitaria exilis]|uniref:Uncharacterized protein n=1 Tax=Digitaria exilis TaxID=1010633 RepID=A0A835C7P0_9POAL|nr:hypothetical protein HU200_022313 [Digitaria exilis]
MRAAHKKNVLVTAACLAKLGGHSVTATCGARNLGLVVDDLSADEALDYTTPEGAALRSPSGNKYDVRWCTACAATGGPWSVFRTVLVDKDMAVDITPGFVAGVTAILQMVTFSNKRLVPLLVTPKKEDMELLLGMVKQGRLKTAKSMSGHATGKVVVEMGAAE